MKRLGWCALVLTAFVVASASPAAADSEIGLSRDGVTWTPSLTAPLIDSDLRWVPGDRITSTFRVRNQSDEPAVMSVDLIGPGAESLLDTGGLTISARGAGMAWQAIAGPGTHRLVSGVDVPPGASTPIDVAVALGADSTNQSMRRVLDLHFRATLTQDSAVASDAGILPDTGAPAAWPLALGLIILGGGIILTSRRRDQGVTHV